MRILFASAELAPVARVGGLAEATAGLVVALRRAGVDVEVVLPDYGDAELVDEVVEPLEVPPWAGPAHVRQGMHPQAGPVTLLGVAGIARPHPYVDERDEPWADNDARFLAFASAVAALATRRLPDVVHLNDWHTAAATAFLGPDIPTLLTIHTLGDGALDVGSAVDPRPRRQHRPRHLGPRDDHAVAHDRAGERRAPARLVGYQLGGRQ